MVERRYSTQVSCICPLPSKDRGKDSEKFEKFTIQRQTSKIQERGGKSCSCTNDWSLNWHFFFCKGVETEREKAMAPHSSTLAWKIPWMEEPGRLQSMGSLKVRHDWATSLSLFTFLHWRRKWQPTPVFLPGESQGCGSLVGCRL